MHLACSFNGKLLSYQTWQSKEFPQHNHSKARQHQTSFWAIVNSFFIQIFSQHCPSAGRKQEHQKMCHEYTNENFNDPQLETVSLDNSKKTFFYYRHANFSLIFSKIIQSIIISSSLLLPLEKCHPKENYFSVFYFLPHSTTRHDILKISSLILLNAFWGFFASRGKLGNVCKCILLRCEMKSSDCPIWIY